MRQTDEILSAREVAELLEISLTTVYTMRHRGRGPASYRRGKRLVFRRSEVEDFLARERALTRRGDGLATA